MDKIFKFYKYQPLSEEKHFGYLQDYLNQKVWMVPLDQLNDPFEGKCSLTPFSPEFVLNNPHIFYAMLKKHHLNGEATLTAEKLKIRLNSEEFRNSLKNKISNFKKHGVLCVTRKNNNIPMWAYYADNHKGYCVEFELDFSDFRKKSGMNPSIIDNFINGIEQGSEILVTKLREYPQSFVFAKVRYSEKMPSMTSDDFVKLDNQYDQMKYFVENSVGVKFIEWKHEDEFRLIVNGNSEESGLLPLKGFAPFLKVTGIIIGDKMKKSKLKRVRNLCQNKQIKLYSASCSDSTYKITIKPYVNVSHGVALHVNAEEV